MNSISNRLLSISSVNKLLEFIENSLVIGAYIGLASIMVVTTTNSVGRYLIGQPIAGIFQATELYFMPALIFLSMAYLQRKEGNVDVDVVSRHFSDNVNYIINITHRVLMIGIFIWIVITAYDQTLNAFVENNWTVGVVSFPVFVSWLILLVGSVLLCARLTLQIISDGSKLVEAIND